MLTQYLAAMMAAGNNVRITTAYFKPLNKWIGWLTLGEAERFKPLFDSGPCFNSEEEALEKMNKLVTDIRDYFNKKYSK